MIRNCCMLVAGLLLHTQIFAQDKTAASRTGEDYTLSNGAVEAVFSGSGSFDIEKLVLNGKQVVGAGKNETPWILIYKGSQGENPELKPEHAVYRGVQVRDDARAKTLVFTWELTLDYSPVKYPVRMYVTLPDGGELLQWNIEADLPAGWLVTDLKFPNVVIERPEDGRIITTEGWGVEKPLDIATFEARYPSHASAMQFLVVHNAEGAFYYGTEDRRGCGKTYSAQCTPTTVALSDAIPASAGWIADGTFRLPWVSVTGFTPKGWEDAVVRWYRPFTFTTEWGRKPLASRNIPQWCYDADAWVRAKHVTDQTCDAEDFATVEGEGDIVHALDMTVNGVPGGQVLHAQHLFTHGVGFIRVERSKLAPYHHGDDVIFTHACRFARADVLPVADHADGVRNGFDLVQLVRNVDTGDAVVLQIADDVEQNRGFLFGERGRWLIKDQQPDLFI